MTEAAAITPARARLIAAGVLVLSSAVTLNVAYLQDGAAAKRVARSKAQSAALQSADRERRLAVDQGRLQLATLVEQTSPRLPASPARQTPPASLAAVAPVAAVPTQPRPGFRLAAWAEQGAIVQANTGRKAAQRTAIIREIQEVLARRGYDPGPADGEVGLITRAAILAFEHDQELPLTGEASIDVHAALLDPTSARRRGAGPATTHAAAQVIQSIQQMLAAQGYFQAVPDGRLGPGMTAAITRFEMDHNLVPSGRISGPLAAALLRPRATPRAQVTALR